MSLFNVKPLHNSTSGRKGNLSKAQLLGSASLPHWTSRSCALSILLLYPLQYFCVHHIHYLFMMAASSSETSVNCMVLCLRRHVLILVTVRTSNLTSVCGVVVQ